ncbi:MAG: hypothetical protein ACFE9L_04190 [Candidatus Hodarchaeota archaeon]
MSEDIDEVSSVTSSIFYAIKNSLSIQKRLLDFSSKITTEISSKRSEIKPKPPSTQDTKFKESFQPKDSRLKKKTTIYQTQSLSIFYPEISEIEEKKKNVRGASKQRIKTRQSPTRKLNSFTIEEIQKLSVEKPVEKAKKKRDLKKKKEIKELKFENRIILSLTDFISEEIVKIDNKPKIISDVDLDTQTNLTPYEIVQRSGTQTFGDQFLSDSDPFPFTSLAEWLLWHRDYPEYSYVREAFDLDQVPEIPDIEVFWVNTMNEPEFFSQNWRIAGIMIEDINTLKFKGRPEGMPEWQILPSETDGLSIFFEDVYRILLQNPQGVQNYNYPILKFALRGLNLLNLANYDEIKERWFGIGGFEDLIIRLRELDQFISDQTNIGDYQRNVEILFSRSDEWYLGLVCFDLVSTQSAFLKHLSNQILEFSADEKIKILNKSPFRDRIVRKLTKLKIFDQIDDKRILDQLKSNQ